MSKTLKKILGWVLLINILPITVVIGEKFFTKNPEYDVLYSYLLGLGADVFIVIAIVSLVFIFSLINGD